MFRFARNLSVRTWYHISGHVGALTIKQAISTSAAGVNKATKAGLWVVLGKDLGRSANAIRANWIQVLGSIH